MVDLHFLTTKQLSPYIKNKQLSPVELTKHFLTRIDQVNPIVHAYITPLHEIALQQAKKAEIEIMNSHYKGPLHGIPIGIKDNYFTKGIRTTAGSKRLADFIPEFTARSVDNLLSKGAIMLGKLNMHEFGGGLTNTNPFYGHTRNPWNIQYTPGGSSGGSGAALASGLATLATGTDTFGSIRVPAAMCGVYGLKPTYDLISTDGVMPLAWSLDHPGPMARSVSDLALMLPPMAGSDAIEHPDLTRSIEGLKIGVPSFFLEDLDHDVEYLFLKAIQTLKSLGAELTEITIPELSMASFAGYVITTGEATAFHSHWLMNPEFYAIDVRVFFQAGLLTTTLQYIRSQQIRRQLTLAFKGAFGKVDVILGPTVPITTPPFLSNWVDQNLDIIQRCMPFTSPATLTGLPSLSVPIGLSSEGLPIGMQLIGNHFTESMLLQAGHVWESTDPLRVTVQSS
ncbi:Asp-tRNA(Asn)/Glu-tRNA(Gln) amidotransferase GatCAB subunit A [Bacillus sp. JCM 19034]|uniref:Asp-tRNA(Asn)/Glu-tRNA(Gln) amidotransferase GatCAB subunit A n=1 Tax=Bacillus sp. JCM 19034 TaxID=1481928 RepID=UPI0007807764|nr:Asp-tRNA(Asn)/Glu-tRNA(Gln) amidotransferase GatCAB subunit A [Bacillus sp. JCM 19034]